MKTAARILSVVEFSISLALFMIGIVYLSIYASNGGLFLGLGIYGLISSTLCEIALHHYSKGFAVLAGVINLPFFIPTSILLFKIPEYKYRIATWKGKGGYISKRIRIPKKIALFTLAGLAATVMETTIAYASVPQIINDPFCRVMVHPLGKECTLVSCTINSTDATLPSYHKGKPICYIANNFFQTVETSVKYSITFPNTYKEISKKCFYENNSISKVTLPDSIEAIRTSAFEGTHIGNIYLGESLNRIDKYAFKKCINLTSVVFKDNLSYIGEQAFYGCSNIDQVCVSTKTVKTIGSQAFGGNNNLKIFVYGEAIPKGWASDWSGDAQVFYVNDESYDKVLDYDYEVRSGGINITNYHGDDEIVKIPEIIAGLPVTKINKGAFIEDTSKKTTRIKEVVLPRTLTTIGDQAFKDCSSLEKINFHEALIYIGEAAFYNTGFTSIEIPKTVKNISKSTFSSCEKLKSANVQASITELPANIFAKYPLFDEFTLGTTIVKLQGDCFSQTAFTTFKVPRSINKLAARAISNMAKLESIYIPKEVTSYESYTVSGNPILKNVYFEKGAYVNKTALFGSGTSTANIHIEYNCDFSGIY